MKKLVVLLAVFAVVGIAVYAIAAPDQVVFEAKNGNVTFEHAKHAGADCITCHHEGSNDAACRSCHDGAAAPSTKAPRGEFHTFCIDCHKGAGMKGTCNDCHKR
ncbi:MAG: cytochrome c family protein [Desulfuromonadales bacterium]|nr:cytochrome c family protein [Desulfuromonadales bacterium]